jgi:hypothetical protein
MYNFVSPIGIWTIRHINHKWHLCFDDECYEVHDDPYAAADNVYVHVTGCYEWDSSIHDAPSDLSEWIRYRPVQGQR